MHRLGTLAAIPLLALGLSGANAQDATQLNQAIGFGARLHSDTEMVLGMRNLADLAEDIGDSRTWKQIARLLRDAGDVDLRDAAMPYEQVMSFIGQDAIIAFGDGADKEFENLMDFYDAYYRIYYKFMGDAVLAEMGIGEGEPDPEQLIRSFLEDDQALGAALKAQVPPMIFGCRPPKGAAAEVLGQLAALEGELPPMVVTAEFQIEGAGQFRSWSIAAKDAFVDEYRAKLREEIGAEFSAKVEQIIDSKRLEVCFGAVGDQLIVSIGPDRSHLKFATGPADSITTKPEFAFIGNYAAKRLLAYSYASEELLESLSQPGQMKTLADAGADILKRMAQGGIEVGKAVPYVQKLGNQLTMFAKLSEADAAASVIYVEDGLKGASIGGYNTPGVDMETPLKLAGALPDDAFLAVSGASDPALDAASMDMIETLGTAAYHIADGLTDMDGDASEAFGMFDQVFKPKLLAIYDIMKTKVHEGLGHEGGLVIDLNGSMPKIPGAPAVIIKEGKLPRVAMFNTVRDRAKLTEAWAELVPAINDLAKAIPGQEPGREFQLPDALSSDGKNVTTHFMGLPFVSNDFLPSLSISDELFFLSTSKNFSEQLAGEIAAGGGEEITGVLIRMQLSELHDYAEGWLDLVLDNSKEVFGGNEFAEEDFKENAGNIRMVLGLLEGLRGFELHSYKDGRQRTDWHLHITDIGG